MTASTLLLICAIFSPLFMGVRMAVYFHCAPITLGAGSIIEPGNWGRMHQFHNWELSTIAKDYKELALEYARQVLRPDAPSRLSCVFTFEDHESALNYARTLAVTAVLHQVQPVDEAVNTFRTRWSLIGIRSEEGVSPFQSLDRDIHRYWQENPDSDVEVLIGGPVRVLKSL